MADEFGNWTVGVDWDLTGFNKSAAHVEKTLKKLVSLQNKLTPAVSPRVSKLAGINEKVNTQGAVVAERRATAAERTTRAAERTARVNKSTAVEGEAWLLRKQRLDFEIFSIESKISSKIKETHREYATLVAQARQLRAASLQAKDAKGLLAYREQIFALKTSVTATTNEIARQNRAMNSQKFAANSLTSSMQNMARSYLSVFAVIGAGRSVFNTASRFDSLDASMLAASGSAEAAADDFRFVTDLSFQMGVGLEAATDGFRQIASAQRFSGVSAEESRKQFTQMTKITRSFGLDTERTKLSLLAFQQMISKGVVSSEELRRQLGENLPGAMAVAADAMGLTGTELDKMLRSGKVITTDFLPKFLDLYEGIVVESGAYAKSLKTITVAQSRFVSEWQLMVKNFSDMGGKSAAIIVLEGLRDILISLAPVLKLVGGLVGTLAIAATGLVTGFTAALSPIAEVINALLSMVGVVGGPDGLVTAFEALGVVMGGVFVMGAGGAIGAAVAAMAKMLKYVVKWRVTLRLIRREMANIAFFSSLTTGGVSALTGAAAFGAVAVGGMALINRSDPSEAPGATTNTDKSTNTTIEKLEVNVTAPAGADANQFGQHVADSMAASMGLSSAITN